MQTQLGNHSVGLRGASRYLKAHVSPLLQPQPQKYFVEDCASETVRRELTIVLPVPDPPSLGKVCRKRCASLLPISAWAALW